MKGKAQFTIDPRLVKAFIESWNKHHYHRKVSEYYINSGWCYQFALLVRKAYGKQVKLCTDLDGGHCWVRVGRRNYDSFHLEGVTYDLGMDYLQEKNVSEERICEVWKERGHSGPVDYKVLEYALKLFKKKSKTESGKSKPIRVEFES